MKNKIDSNELIISQSDLSNALTGLKIFVNNRFNHLGSVTVDDISALNGLVSCLDSISSKQFDNLIDFFE